MNTQRNGQTPSASPSAVDAFVTVEVRAQDDAPAARIAARLAGQDLAQVFLFASPERDLSELAADLSALMPGLPVTGCSTAGEIGRDGYSNGHVIAVGLPAGRFATRAVVIERLSALDPAAISRKVLAERLALMGAHPGLGEGFAFLMVDGLSLREDVLTAAIAPALGGLPLFGGSAGDGDRFDRTRVAIDGRVLEDAAILTFVATDYRVKVFSFNHFRPTATRMVVTAADPERRVVKEINAEPAGREYARIVGQDPGQLDEFIFAAHPVAVRLGDTHHVRAIQRVNRAGELVFFSAIDEGMVLSVVEAEDMVAHLDGALGGLKSTGPAPAGILACDCMLRRVEAEQTQRGRDVSEVLARYGVRGFNTYGEQVGPMHLNQTMTGVALFAPDGGGP
ncbi:MAG: FIST N-terminal domain-containing protein [Pseudomonadota bacterium]